MNESEKIQHSRILKRGLGIAAATIRAQINIGIRENLPPWYILWLVCGQCHEYTDGIEDEMEEFLNKLPKPKFKTLDEVLKDHPEFDDQWQRYDE